jgi:hypothetical protein
MDDREPHATGPGPVLPVTELPVTELPVPEHPGPAPSGQGPAGEPPVPRYDRLPLLGAWVKFNVKLVLDGVLDLLLLPASFIAVALGLLRGGDAPDRHFRALLLFGRRSERFINLFGNHRRGSVDDVLGDCERQVADEFERRGWSGKAEAALRRTDITPVHTPVHTSPPPPPADDMPGLR